MGVGFLHRWVRWLALVALIGQLVVASGHVHVARLAQGSQPAFAEQTCPTAGRAPCAPDRPADPAATCDVCWAMALAGLGVIPVATEVSAPLGLAEDIFTVADTARAERAAASSFQARAPPSDRAA